MNHCRWLLSLSVLGLTACDGVVDRAPATFAVRDSADVQILEGPPLDSFDRTRLRPAATGAAELPIIEISDVRRAFQDNLLMLDRTTGEVWILTLPDLEKVGQIAGLGEGPGQVRRPAAVAAHGGDIVVWDSGHYGFHVFDSQGEFVRWYDQPEVGDLEAFSFREDQALEDVRLRVRGDGSRLWLQLEESELSFRTEARRGPIDVPRSGYLTVLADGFTSLDTVITYEAPARTIPPRGPTIGPPVHAGRPLWAVDGDLVALARSDRSAVHLYDLEGTVRHIVRWEGVERRITARDKLLHAKAMLRERPSDFPDEWRRAWEDEEQLQRAADAVRMTAHAPQLTGVDVVGDCVWISRFDPRSSSGSGGRWHVVHLDTGQSRSIEFSGSAPRPTYFDDEVVLARDVQEYDRHVVSLYVLPSSLQAWCGGSGATQ